MKKTILTGQGEYKILIQSFLSDMHNSIGLNMNNYPISTSLRSHVLVFTKMLEKKTLLIYKISS